jgi:hypothetical protein
MATGSLTAVERRVLDHDPHANGERIISGSQARALIASGHYRRSLGSPLGAEHFRRALASGGCLHLAIEGRRRRLHHDAFDPGGGALSLAMHITHEARAEAVSNFALAWIVVRLLAR